MFESKSRVSVAVSCRHPPGVTLLSESITANIWLVIPLLQPTCFNCYLSSLFLPPGPPYQSLLTLVLHSIVFVHGLNGHPHHTWATHKPEAFWPADLLPSALEEQHVRILTYGYDANVGVFTDGASKDKIHNHAEHLASRLTANRSVS